jgi:pepF/M3 family oligoendopeptidase
MNALDVTDNFPTSDPSWDLESIFPGGAESEEFQTHVDAVESEVDALHLRIAELPALGELDEWTDEELTAWADFIASWEQVSERATQARAFARAIASTHADDPAALRLPSRLNEAYTRLDGLEVGVKARFHGADDDVFDALSEHPSLNRCELYLRELREEADRSMDPRLEELAVELNRDGVHAWGQLYDQVSSTLSVEIEREDGAVDHISVGQAKNLKSRRDRDLRRKAHEGLQRAWGSRATTFAAAINAITGSRQTLYDRRGGDELTYPLFRNRVQRETVEAMMAAADEYREVLGEYRSAKATLLGLDKLEWYDLRAPVGDDTGDELSYVDAQEFIVEQVDDFSERMGQFYRHALANQWVEAEDRPGKGQGGYCTGFPLSEETRIFMTYGGTTSSAQTLAHELGHAYHGWILSGLGQFERLLPMGLAETASTLAEALVERAAFEKAGPEAKLRLLDERLQRADAFLVNIPARYRLERRMHAERRNGQLDEDLLADITREIFEAHYGPSMANVDELFWAAKLHFFISRLPFYNFPYTFGYLFSRAVGARALQEGPAYAEVVDDLLRDTGRLTAEEVGERYLDADLGSVDFWRDAAASTREDVEAFVEAVEERTG